MPVRFSEVDEWLEELELYAEHCKRELENPSVVRTSIVRQNESPVEVFLTAGFVVDDMLLHELTAYCGSDYVVERMSEGTDQATAERARIRGRAEELGFECRGGRYEM